MSDLPIPAEAIEAAAKVFEQAYGEYDEVLRGEALRDAEAALRAAFDALGTRAEERAINYEHKERRLASRWFPVKP